MIALGAKIDLGEKHSRDSCAPCAPTGEYFPRIYISGQKKPLVIPAKGKAVVEYRVAGRSMNQSNNEEARHSTDIEIHSIEPLDDEGDEVREGEPAKLLSDFRRVIGLDRKRNGEGEFVANDTGGADPSSMQAAYGPGTVAAIAGTTGVFGAGLGLAGRKLKLALSKKFAPPKV